MKTRNVVFVIVVVAMLAMFLGAMAGYRLGRGDERQLRCLGCVEK